MRIAFIIFLFLLTISVSSQNSFARQLNQIIKDSANHFSKFKGNFKEMHNTDSVFYSIITLEGTSNNDIVLTQVLPIQSLPTEMSMAPFRKLKTLKKSW